MDMLGGPIIIVLILSFDLLIRSVKHLGIGTSYAVFTGIGVVGMVIGVAQVQWLPAYLGLEHWLTAPLAVLIALVVGGSIGLFQGWLIAYLGIPSFIVTLGGLLVWCGAAWWVTTGQTVAPMDTRFKAFGGGVEGALGATATWVIAAIACGLIIVALGLARHRRLRFGFPVRPGWADAVIAAVACVAVLVIGSFSWAVGSIYSRHATLPRSPFIATAMQMLAGGAALTIVAVLHGELAAGKAAPILVPVLYKPSDAEIKEAERQTACFGQAAKRQRRQLLRTVEDLFERRSKGLPTDCIVGGKSGR